MSGKLFERSAKARVVLHLQGVEAVRARRANGSSSCILRAIEALRSISRLHAMSGNDNMDVIAI